MVTLGRVVASSEKLADIVISNNDMNLIVGNLSQDNKYYKRAAAYAVKGIAKHSERHATALVNANVFDGLSSCLIDLDTNVRESSIWAVGYIVRHSAQLADIFIQKNLLPHIVAAYAHTSELLVVRKISASVLGDISKHDERFAGIIVNQPTIIETLINDLKNSDFGLKRQVTACLSQLCKHSSVHAKSIVTANLFPALIVLLRDTNEHVRKNACVTLREISHHGLELSSMVVEAGALVSLTEYLSCCTSADSKLPAVVCLGYIASFSDQLAKHLIVSNVLPYLKSELIDEPDNSVKAAIAWGVGIIGGYSAEHAKLVNDHDILSRLLAVHLHKESSEDLKDKAKKSYHSIINQTETIDVLLQQFQIAPDELLSPILRKLSEILTHNIDAKKKFVQAGLLQRMQTFQPTSIDGDLVSAIELVKSIFPADILELFAPSATVLHA